MDGQLSTSLYDKHDDFHFHITNFPFPSSNIPSSPSYGVLTPPMRQDLPLLWMFYSEGNGTFQLASWAGIWQGKFKIDSKYILCSVRGSLKKKNRYPLPTVTRHSGGWTNTVTPSIDQTFTFFYHVTDLDLITEIVFLPKVSIEHLQRVMHDNRGRLLLRTSCPVLLWDLHEFLCLDQSLLNLSCFGNFEFRISLGTSILLPIDRTTPKDGCCSISDGLSFSNRIIVGNIYQNKLGVGKIRSKKLNTLDKLKLLTKMWFYKQYSLLT